MDDLRNMESSDIYHLMEMSGCEAVRERALSDSDQVSEADLQLMWGTLDQDGNGQITFDEFHAFVQGVDDDLDDDEPEPDSASVESENEPELTATACDTAASVLQPDGGSVPPPPPLDSSSETMRSSDHISYDDIGVTGGDTSLDMQVVHLHNPMPPALNERLRAISRSLSNFYMTNS